MSRSNTSTSPAQISLRSSDDGPAIVLSGRWTLVNLPALRAQADALALPSAAGPGSAVAIDASGIESTDTAGMWVLLRLRSRLTDAGRAVEIVGLADDYADLLALVEKRLSALAGIPRPEVPNFVEKLGRGLVAQVQDMLALLAFIGEATIALGRQLRNPRRIRFKVTAKIVEESGLNALPIVGLLVFLLGIVVAYQGGRQLKIYGANIFVVEMVCLIMLRELAPLIAAIIVAGRTGSAYAAEIGTMRVTEEIDALTTLGIGPFDQLVLPKVTGLMIALPLLTMFADILGVFGGMVMAVNVLDVSFVDFVDRIPVAISTSDFVVGVVKAPIFALIIAMVGCHQGFQVAGGADSVGRQTTVAVVQSIFLVIVTDAAFSVLFSWMGV